MRGAVALRDQSRLSDNFHAKGHVSIDFTDPLTGKVIDKVDGDNHAFKEYLSTTNLVGWMNSVTLHITEGDGSPVNTSFPWMRGDLIGFGTPYNGSSGTLRGAYDSTTSYTGKRTPFGLSSKYSYQFTPSQALGRIGEVGLTSQFVNTYSLEPSRKVLSMPQNGGVYQHGLLDGTTTGLSYPSKNTFDINRLGPSWQGQPDAGVSLPKSTFVVTATAEQIGNYKMGHAIDAKTGRVYIVVWWYKQNTPSRGIDLVIYEFAGLNDPTLLRVRTITDVQSPSFPGGGYYSYYKVRSVRNGNLYLVCSNATDAGNGTTNMNMVAINLSTMDARFVPLPRHYGKMMTPSDFVRPVSESVDFFYEVGDSSGTYRNYFFDYNTETVIASITSPNTNSAHFLLNPFYENAMYYSRSETTPGDPIFLGAGAIYKVPDGVVRPSNSGMTITYELEVYY